MGEWNLDLSKKRSFLILIIIILMQLAVIFYWGGRKANFYWDEYYSFENTHFISDSTSYPHRLVNDERFIANTWMPVSLIKEFLSVNPEDSVIQDNPLSTIRKLFKYNNYFVFLNIFEALFFPGETTAWPAVILNAIIFVLNQLVLYKLVKEMSKEQTVLPLAVTAFYGFSSICLSMVVFVRFYMYATLMNTIFVYFHLKFWKLDGTSLIRRLVYLLVIALSFLVGYNNAQFMAIFAGMFMVSFAIGLLIKKRVKNFLIYSVPVFGGGFVYLATQTDYLSIIFDFQGTLHGTNGAIIWCLEQIVYFRPYMLPGRLKDMALALGKYMFGSFFVMILFCAVVICALIIKAVKGDIGKRSALNKPQDDSVGGFLAIVFVSTFLFMAFFTTFGLFEQIRYIAYVFPEIAIIVMLLCAYALDSKNMQFKFSFLNNRNLTVLAMLFLVVMQILAVNIKGKVDMIYQKDKDGIAKIRSLNADSMIIYGGATREFIVYQASLFVDKNAEFFPCDEGNLENLEETLRDEMMLVEYVGADHKELTDMLEKNGYTMDYVGSTYNFNAYQVRR